MADKIVFGSANSGNVSYCGGAPRRSTTRMTITYRCGCVVILDKPQDEADHVCMKCFTPIVEICTRQIFTD